MKLFFVAACLAALALIATARDAFAAAGTVTAARADALPDATLAPPQTNLWVGTFSLSVTGANMNFTQYVLDEIGNVVADGAAGNIANVRIFRDNNDADYNNGTTSQLCLGAFNPGESFTCSFASYRINNGATGWIHVVLDITAAASDSTLIVRLFGITHDGIATIGPPVPLRTITIETPPPTVTGCSPLELSNFADAAGTVNVTGTNFASGCTIRETTSGQDFGSPSCPTSTSASGTYNPSGLAAGGKRVEMTIGAKPPGGMNDCITIYGPGAPTVASVTPASGANDAPVGITLSGKNFCGGAGCPGPTSVCLSDANPVNGSCDVNLTASCSAPSNDRTLACTVPAGTPGAAYNVVVTTGIPPSSADDAPVTIDPNNNYSVISPKLYYVSKTSCDDLCLITKIDNPASPFCTIQAAFNCVGTNTGNNLTDGGPNDGPQIIQVQDSSVYNEAVNLAALTTNSGNGLTLRAAAGQSPVLDNANTNHLTRVAISYVTLKGFTFRNSWQRRPPAVGGNNIEGSGVILTAATTGVTVEDCVFHDNGHAVSSANFAQTNLTVRRNTIYSNDGGGVTLCYANATCGGSANNHTGIVVENNVFYENGDDLNGAANFTNWTAVELYRVTSSRVVNNTFHNNAIAAGNNNNWNGEIYVGTGSSGVLIKNNVFYNARADAANHFFVHEAAAGGVSASSNYNNYYATLETGGQFKQAGGTRTFAEWKTNTSADAASIQQDPLFVDRLTLIYANRNYRLQSNFGACANPPTCTTWTTFPAHSPSIDTGDPADSVSSEQEDNGNRINQGAYGGTAQTSLSGCFGYDITWVGRSNGNWSTGNNWSNRVLPATTDQVCIADPADVLFAFNAVTLDADAAIARLTLASAATPGYNAGRLVMDNDNNVADDFALTVAGNVDLQAGSTVTFSANPANTLDNGALRVGGNFTQSGALTANSGMVELCAGQVSPDPEPCTGAASPPNCGAAADQTFTATASLWNLCVANTRLTTGTCGGTNGGACTTSSFTVKNNFTSNGSFRATSGAVTLVGNAAGVQTITGAAGDAFFVLDLDATTPPLTVDLNGTARVNSAFSVNDGALSITGPDTLVMGAAATLSIGVTTGSLVTRDTGGKPTIRGPQTAGVCDSFFAFNASGTVDIQGLKLECLNVAGFNVLASAFTSFSRVDFAKSQGGAGSRFVALPNSGSFTLVTPSFDASAVYNIQVPAGQGSTALVAKASGSKGEETDADANGNGEANDNDDGDNPPCGAGNCPSSGRVTWSYPEFLWTGDVSNVWSNDANWDCGGVCPARCGALSIPPDCPVTACDKDFMIVPRTRPAVMDDTVSTGDILVVSGGNLDTNGKDVYLHGALVKDSGSTLTSSTSRVFAVGAAGGKIDLTGGGTLSQLLSHKPSGSGAKLTVASSLTVSGATTLQCETLDLAGTLTQNGALTVAAGATLDLGATGDLKLGGVTVDVNGTLRAASTNAEITSTSPTCASRHTFNVNSGATLVVTGLTFSCVNLNGFDLKNCADLMKPATTFNNVTFKDAAPGGAHLSIGSGTPCAGDGTKTLFNHAFDDSFGGGQIVKAFSDGIDSPAGAPINEVITFSDYEYGPGTDPNAVELESPASSPGPGVELAWRRTSAWAGNWRYQKPVTINVAGNKGDTVRVFSSVNPGLSELCTNSETGVKGDDWRVVGFDGVRYQVVLIDMLQRDCVSNPNVIEVKFDLLRAVSPGNTDYTLYYGHAGAPPPSGYVSPATDVDCDVSLANCAYGAQVSFQGLWSARMNWSPVRAPDVNTQAVVNAASVPFRFSPTLDVVSTIRKLDVANSGASADTTDALVLTTNNLTVRENLTILTAGKVDATGSIVTIKVGGAWANLGSFVAGNTTVEFNGTVNQAITDNDPADPFYHVRITNPVGGGDTCTGTPGKVCSGSNLIVQGDFISTTGQFEATGGSNLSLTGSAAQALTVAGDKFINLTIANTGATSATEIVTASGTGFDVASALAVNDGNLRLDGAIVARFDGSVTVASGAILSSNSSTGFPCLTNRASTNCTTSSAGANYAFTVNGALDLAGLKIDRVNANGLSLGSTASITQASELTFTRGAGGPGSAYVKLPDADVNWTFLLPDFDANALSNVSAQGSVRPLVQIIAGRGSKGEQTDSDTNGNGEANDSDPGDPAPVCTPTANGGPNCPSDGQITWSYPNFVWEGDCGTDWNDGRNWKTHTLATDFPGCAFDGVNCTTNTPHDVLIQPPIVAGPDLDGDTCTGSNNPNLSAPASVTIRDLTLANAANLIVSNTTLTITRDFFKSGGTTTFSHTAGTVTFDASGPGVTTLTKITAYGDVAFNNLQISHATPGVTTRLLGGNLTVNGLTNFTVDGDIDLNKNNLTAMNNVTVNGTVELILPGPSRLVVDDAVASRTVSFAGTSRLRAFSTTSGRPSVTATTSGCTVTPANRFAFSLTGASFFDATALDFSCANASGLNLASGVNIANFSNVNFTNAPRDGTHVTLNRTAASPGITTFSNNSFDCSFFNSFTGTTASCTTQGAGAIVRALGDNAPTQATCNTDPGQPPTNGCEAVTFSQYSYADNLTPPSDPSAVDDPQNGIFLRWTRATNWAGNWDFKRQISIENCPAGSCDANDIVRLLFDGLTTPTTGADVCSGSVTTPKGWDVRIFYNGNPLQEVPRQATIDCTPGNERVTIKFRLVNAVGVTPNNDYFLYTGNPLAPDPATQSMAATFDEVLFTEDFETFGGTTNCQDTAASDMGIPSCSGTTNTATTGWFEAVGCTGGATTSSMVTTAASGLTGGSTRGAEVGGENTGSDVCLAHNYNVAGKQGLRLFYFRRTTPSKPNTGNDSFEVNVMPVGGGRNRVEGPLGNSIAWGAQPDPDGVAIPDNWAGWAGPSQSCAPTCTLGFGFRVRNRNGADYGEDLWVDDVRLEARPMDLDGYAVATGTSCLRNICTSGQTTVIGLWNDPFNWSPKFVPDQNTDATIDSTVTAFRNDPDVNAPATLFSLQVLDTRSSVGTDTDALTVGALLTVRGNTTVGAAGKTAKVGGTREDGFTPGLQANIDVNGTFTMNAGATLDFTGSSNTLFVQGDFTNAGAIVPGSGTVTFDGSGAANQVLTLTAATDFNHLTVSYSGTGDVTTAGSPALLGNFSSNGNFVQSTGTTTFKGTAAQTLAALAGDTFFNLTVNNTAVSPAVDEVTATNAVFRVNGATTVTAGALKLVGATTLTQVGAFDVQSSGRLIAQSSGGGAPEIRSPAAGQFYALTVQGRLDLNGLILRRLDNNGLNVTMGPFIDALNEVQFLEGQNGATSAYLRMPDATYNLQFLLLTFDANAAYNVRMPAVGGGNDPRLAIQAGQGAKGNAAGGEANDCDPGDATYNGTGAGCGDTSATSQGRITWSFPNFIWDGETADCDAGTTGCWSTASNWKDPATGLDPPAAPSGLSCPSTNDILIVTPTVNACGGGPCWPRVVGPPTNVFVNNITMASGTQMTIDFGVNGDGGAAAGTFGVCGDFFKSGSATLTDTDGTLEAGGGTGKTFTLLGNATFKAFRLNKGLSTDTLTLSSGDLTVNTTSTLDAGTLDPGGRTLTALGNLNVNASGVLRLTATSTLKMGDATAATVNGALTSPVGSAPTITGNGAPCTAGRYTFTVNGTLNVNALNFSCAQTNGLNITSSASLVTANNVNFSSAAPGAGGTHLTLNRAAPSPEGFTFTLENPSFDASFGQFVAVGIGTGAPAQAPCNPDPPAANCEIVTFNNFSGPANPQTLDSETLGIKLRWTRTQRWKGDWDSKRPITINATGTAGATVRLYFTGTTTPSASDIFNGSTSAIDCDDVRIYYDDSPRQDVPRHVIQCTSTVVEIKFQLVKGISSVPDNFYFLYYGNPNATNPPVYAADVVLFTDDFERGPGGVGNGWVQGSDNPLITGGCAAGGSTGGLEVGAKNRNNTVWIRRTVSTAGRTRIFVSFSRSTTPDFNASDDFYRFRSCTSAGAGCTTQADPVCWIGGGVNTICYAQPHTPVPPYTLTGAYENNANFTIQYDIDRDRSLDEDLCVDDVKVESRPCNMDMQTALQGSTCPNAGAVTVGGAAVAAAGKVSDPFNWTPLGPPDSTTLARVEFGELLSGVPNNFRHAPDVDTIAASCNAIDNPSTFFSLDLVNTQSQVGGAADVFDLTGNPLNVIGNVTISTNGRLTAGAGPICVGGNWTDSGTTGFAAGTGTVNFNGGGSQIITTTKDFNHLTVSNNAPGGTNVTTTSIFKVKGTFSSPNGKFVASTPSTITIEATAGGNRTLTASCPVPYTTCDTFFNLTVNNSQAAGSDAVDATDSRFRVLGVMSLVDGVFKLAGDDGDADPWNGEVHFGPSALLDLQSAAELETRKSIATEHCDADDAPSPWAIGATTFPKLTTTSGNFSFNSAGYMDFDGLFVERINNAGINITSNTNDRFVQFGDVCFTGGQNGAGSKYVSVPNAAVSYFMLRPYFDASAVYNVSLPSATPSVTIAQAQGVKGEEADSGADGTGESNDCDPGDPGGCGDPGNTSQGRVIWVYPGFIWTAGGGTDVWNLAANWSCASTGSCTCASTPGYPTDDASTRGCTALILDRGANDPNLSGALNAEVKDLVVASGTLNVTSSGNLDVYGDLFRGADLDPDTTGEAGTAEIVQSTGPGSIRMTGTLALQRVTLAGGGTLRKLVVLNTNNGGDAVNNTSDDGTVRLEENLTIQNFLNVTDGILDVNGKTLSMDSTASLNVGASGRLKASGTSALTAKDLNSATPEIDCQPDGYTFEINGTVDVNGLDVSCANDYGARFTTAATLAVDPLCASPPSTFRDVRFHKVVDTAGIADPATHLTLERAGGWNNTNAGAWDCSGTCIVLFRDLKFDNTFVEGTGRIIRASDSVAGGTIRVCDFFYGGVGNPDSLDCDIDTPTGGGCAAGAANTDLVYGRDTAWAGNWDYKRQISLVPSTPKGGRVRIHLTGATSPTAAEFFNVARLDTTGTCPNSGAPVAGTVGEDVRIVAFVANNNKFEYRSIPFTFVDGDGTCKFSAAQVVIRFDLIQAAGANNIDYTLYYGNPDATGPAVWPPPPGPTANRDQDAGQVTVGAEAPVSGLWSDPFNWSPAGAPDFNTNVRIDDTLAGCPGAPPGGCFRHDPELNVAAAVLSLNIADSTSSLADNDALNILASAGATPLTVGWISNGDDGLPGTADDETLGGNLTIGTNAKLDASGITATIAVRGDWTDSATAGLGFSPGTTTVEFSGKNRNQVVSITNSTVPSPKNFHHVNVTHSGTGAVQIGNGTVWGVRGNFTSNGTLSLPICPCTGLVLFNGTSNQTLATAVDGTAPDDTFQDLTVNSQGAAPNNVVSPPANLRVDGTLAVNGGVFSLTGPRQVRIGGAVTVGAGGTFRTNKTGGTPVLVHTSANAAGDVATCTGSYGFTLGGVPDVNGLDVRCLNGTGVNVTATGKLDVWNEAVFSRPSDPGAGSTYLNAVNDAGVCAGGSCTVLLNSFDANTDKSVTLAAGTNLTLEMVNSVGNKGQRDTCPGAPANDLGGEEYDGDPNDVTGAGTVDCPDNAGSITWRYAHFIWQGGTVGNETVWELGSNWQVNAGGTCATPPAYPDNSAAANGCDVLILDQLNDPTLVTNIDIRDLFVVGGAVLTVNAGTTQQLRGELFKSASATIAHNNGALTFADAGNKSMTIFGGATFRALTLNKFVQGDTITLKGGDLRVSGELNITVGTLNLNGFDLTQNVGDTGNTTVGAAGALTLTGASSMVLAAGRTVSIAGNFTATPSGGNTPTITSTNPGGAGADCVDRFGAFTVTGGTLNVTGLNFSCSNNGAEANGFDIAAAATIANFNNVALTKTRPDTTHLSVRRQAAAAQTFTGLSFDCSYYQNWTGPPGSCTTLGAGRIVKGYGNDPGNQAPCDPDPPAVGCEIATFAQYTAPSGVDPSAQDAAADGILLRWTRVLRWAGDYAFKRSLSVGAGYSAGQVAQLTIPGGPGSVAEQIATIPNSQADGDDFRLFHLGTGVPVEVSLDRDSMVFDTSGIDVKFRLIANTPDSNYIIVYGYPAAGAGPTDPIIAKVMEDTFSRVGPFPTTTLGNAEIPAGAPGPFAWLETVGDSNIRDGLLGPLGDPAARVGGAVENQGNPSDQVEIVVDTTGFNSIGVSYERATGLNQTLTAADTYVVEWTTANPPVGTCNSGGSWTVLETLSNGAAPELKTFALPAAADNTPNLRLRFCQILDDFIDGELDVDNARVSAGAVNVPNTALTVGNTFGTDYFNIKGDMNQEFNWMVSGTRSGGGTMTTDVNTELEIDSAAQAFYHRPELNASISVFAVRVLATASGDPADTNAMYLHDPDANPVANTYILTTTGQFKVGDNAAGKTARIENVRQILDVNGNFEIDTGSVMDATLPAVETGTIKVAGHWTKNGNFFAGQTTVEFDAASGTQNVTGATTFYKLKTTNGSTANVPNGFTIASGGTWTFESPNVVKVANSQSITVTGGLIARCSGGGAVTAFNASNVARCGANDAPTLTSSNETTDRFSLNLNGTVNITAMNFKFGSCAGMNISSSANVTNLAGVSFRNASTASGCGHLTINQDGPFSPRATDLVFDASFDTTSLGLSGETASAGYNVMLCDTSAAANTNVEMYLSQVVANTQGAGGGEPYDREDPPDDGTANTVNDCPINGGKVEWGPPAGGQNAIFGKFRGKVAIAEDWSGNYRGTFVVTDDSLGANVGLHTVFAFNDNGGLKYGTVAASSFDLNTGTCDNGGASCGLVIGGVLYVNEGAVVGEDYLWIGTDQGFIYKLKDVALVEGTASGAAATTLTDSSKSWTNNQWTAKLVFVTSGTGMGQVRTISSNTVNTLTVSSAWATIPSTDSKYIIGEVCASGVPAANTGLCAIDLNGVAAGVALRLGTNVTAPLFADFELVYAVSLVGGTPTLFAIEQSDTYDCTYYSCDGVQHENWSLVAPGVGQIVEVPAMEETYDSCPTLGGPDTTTILHFGGEGAAPGGAGLLARVVVERRDSATCPATGNPSATVPTTLATSGDVVAPTVLGAGLFVGTVAPTQFVGANQTTYAALDNDGVGGADFPYPATKGVPVTLGDVTAEIAYHAGKNWALVGDLNGQLHCVAVTGASAGNRCTVDWPVEPNVAAGYAVRAAPILSAGVVYVVVADGTNNSEVHAYDMERKVTVCPSSGAAAGGPCEITSTNNPGTNKGYPYTFGADSRQKGGIMITQTRVIVLLDDGRIVAVPRFTSDPTP